MMKHTKRFASFLLALLMALTMMAVPAFAAGETGSITINNAIPGETYKIYQIFQLEGYSGDAYAYKIDMESSPWKDFFGESGTGADYVTIDAQGYVTWKSEKDDETGYAAFAKAALLYAQQNNINNDGIQTAAGTGDTATVKFEKLSLGYYLVDSSLGTLAILDSTDPEFTAIEKNLVPSVDKEVEEDFDKEYGDSNTADIGQKVNFRTIITIKGGARKYVLHDEMTGLTFDSSSVKVQYQQATGTDENGNYLYSYGLKNVTGYTLTSPVTSCAGNTYANCTFEISFEQSFLDTLNTGDQIVVTYTATVNADAVVGGEGNSNKTKVTYGDSNQSSDESETETYTWDVDIFKYTGADTPLAGATFTLSKNADGTDPIALVNEGNNAYRVAATDDTDTITAITTDNTGKFTIKGLDSDTYYLTETKQPDGYNKLADPIKIVIYNTGAIAVDDDTISGNEVKVLNNTGSILPTTGGMGTTIFYVLGGALMAGAVVLLVTKKRMSRTEK